MSQRCLSYTQFFFPLKKHHDQCFNFPVVCPNEECSEELKRCEVTYCIM